MSQNRGKPKRGRGLAGRFARDEGGAIAVILALMLFAIGGMMALAMDLGKAWNLETELQHAADACALAGATQLDGSDGARARAIQVCLSELPRNQQTFASDGLGANVTFDASVAVDSGTGKMENRDIKFYTELPIEAKNEATSDDEALFIEANVFPRRVDFAFAALVGAVTSASPRARAVAGWQSFFCDSPPMMMCNPAEPVDEDGDSLDPNAGFNLYSSCPDYGDGTSCVGRGITMKARAGAPVPGDFGYLSLSIFDPATGETTTVTGANELKDALASVEYGAVCTGNQVTTEPGNMASLDQFINQRFDLYPDLTTAQNPNRQPAPNVGKGLVPKPSFDPGAGNCKYNPASEADSGDWKKPRNSDPDDDREFYRGPGQHNMVDMSPVDGDADANPDYPADGPPGLVDPYIRAMAYPKDACNYTWDDTDEATYQAQTGEPVKATPGGCLFKVPPGDSTPEGEQIGTGQWDIQMYLNVYHPGMTEADLIADGADLPNDLTVPDPDATKDGKISRWELYNWEKRLEGGTYPNLAYEEEPICYRAPEVFPTDYTLPEDPPAGPGKPDRRIIVMAVVNCAAMGGGRRTVDRTRPHGNVGVFLTEPMGYTVADTLFGELVDPLGLGLSDVDTNPNLVTERILLIE